VANPERVRLEIGFDGGQIRGAVVSGATADELEKALAAGTQGTIAVDDEEGRFIIVLARVAYVKRFTREPRVGFGAA
jgi:hypothetical protein